MTVTLETYIAKFIGLSTDSKPTSVPIGSTFWEYDTRALYVCRDGTNWNITSPSFGSFALSTALVAASITGTATQFTVSGGPILIKSLGMLVTTNLPAGANTLKFSFTPAGGAATDLSGATDTASAAATQLFMLDGVKATGPVKTTDVGIQAAGQALHMPIIVSPGVIRTIFSAGPPATGAVTIFLEYEPLSLGATVW